MFKDVRKSMQEAFLLLIKEQVCLFITDVDKDTLWTTYLESFAPENKQEHNCNYCRSFIKNYGNVVAIVDNKLKTIWEFTPPDEEFTDVIKNMHKLVAKSQIRDIFLAENAKIGVSENIQRFTKNEAGNQIPLASPITWNHFSLELPKAFVHKGSLSIESVMGTARDAKNVFKRSLDEITLDSVETVLELIAQNSLYRGEEFKGILTDFLKHKKAYSKCPTSLQDNYAWNNATKMSSASAKIRNTSIGTLLTEISEGKELDFAVTAFERMVAPTNYKRPTALITKRMIEDAEKTINELGYTESLARRFAVPEDVAIKNVLFVNRDAKKLAGVFNELKENVAINPKSLTKLEEITIDKFINEILPNSKGIQLLFENTHLNNLVSLITAENKDAPALFKWNNPFSWSYTNAVTDSIKEQVKAAGGRVEGELRVSLSWFNYDDLDLHVKEPSGNMIWFRNKLNPITRGHLDVDMNAGSGNTRNAVENVIWPSKTSMQDGEYKVYVNNFAKRENKDVGFIVEVEQNGQIFNFGQEKAVRDKETVEVARFTYSKKDGIKFGTTVESKVLSKEKWGISTNKFYKVKMIMNSPNFWEGNIGNKHTFFILEGAKNDESARGFFNEFLKEELVKNKKVFEVLGGKLKVADSDKQLSGLGFSSTQRASIILKVEGKFDRLLKINI